MITHFYDKVTEVQRGHITCPRSQNISGRGKTWFSQVFLMANFTFLIISQELVREAFRKVVGLELLKEG